MNSIEVGKAGPAARAELEQLRARAAQLEQQLQAEDVPGTVGATESGAGGATREKAPSIRDAAHVAVAERWQQVAGVAAPSPENPRAAAQPEAITLQLAPEEHDELMGGIIGILQERGVSKAIAAAEQTGNPHLIDDFHRILVEWVREGLPAKGAEEKKYRTALSLVLFEITFPSTEQEKDKPADAAKAVHDFIQLMEQLYRGMLQMDAKKGEYFSFEIANPANASHIALYIAVPHARRALFEKLLSGLYPSARLTERRDDYNIFASGAEVAAAHVALAERPIYALRLFDQFPNDPLDVLLNAFSKLERAGEGAAVQFVVSPADHGLLKHYRTALEDIRSGTPLHHATNVKTGFVRVMRDVVSVFSAPEKLDVDKRLAADDPRLKNIESKIASPIVHAVVRVVASAATRPRAESILQELEGPFQQFADTAGNRLEFHPVSHRRIKTFAQQFSYRLFEAERALPLSTQELATIAHLPGSTSKVAAPELRQEKSAAAAPPSDLPQTGAVLGVNKFRGSTQEVRIVPEDRLRHLYVIGQTGTGKSTLLKNVIIQDIKSGAGVCMIDPHGSDVLDVLSAVPPERMADVIYFDPGATERPMALNMLEYDASRPEQKTLVVDELFGIFKKLFGASPESMGPAFEQYFRNSALLVMEDPASGNTLLDITRVFSDEAFRLQKLAACKNPIVKRFWEDIAMKTTGEQGLENYAPYVTNKFDVFTTNEIMRPIIAQQHSSFNFREIMDTKKILLVNLAKGRIGEINANLLGLIIVGKFLIAALSRADSVGKEMAPFYLHIDEFQNVTTPSIATILSEARKYRLSLTVAHQFIAQLTDEIRDAVFGNVGSICAFRIGAADAEQLEKQFAPTFSARDLMNVDNRNAYIKMLINGKPSQPFNIETLPFEAGTQEFADQMRQMSYLRYGRPRADIEAEIASNLSSSAQSPATLAQGGL